MHAMENTATAFWPALYAVGNKRKVLVVDDSTSTRRLLNANLVHENFEVIEAASLAEAEEIVASSDDLSAILLDWFLNDADGVKSLKSLKRLVDFKQVPVCMMSASRDHHIIEQALENGAADFIIKGSDPDLYVHKLRLLTDQLEPYANPYVNCVSVIGAMVSSRYDECQCTILNLSEVGCELESNVQFVPKEIVKIRSAYLNSMIDNTNEDVWARVLIDRTQKSKWKIRCEFIGLSEEQMQKIRKITMQGQFVIDHVL